MNIIFVWENAEKTIDSSKPLFSIILSSLILFSHQNITIITNSLFPL